MKRTFSQQYNTPKRARASYKPMALHTRVTPSIRTFVRKAIEKQAEKKHCVTYASNQPITTAAATTPFGLYLSPVIAQGGGDGQRIGNRIKLLSSHLKIAINLLPYNATTNPLPPPLYVRVMVVTFIRQNTNLASVTDADTALFEVNSGTVGCQGTVLDTTLPINDQSYKVWYDKVVKLGSTGTSATTPVSSGAYFDMSEMSCLLEIPINNLGTYVYADTTSNVPRNKNTFLFLQPVTADGQAGGGYVMAECHYTILSEYTDI